MSENRGNFENAWKNAMGGKEINPPGSVWNGIQSNLKEDTERKLFILPKMLAAASLFIGLSLALYYGFFDDYSFVSEDNQISQKDSSMETTRSMDKGNLPLKENDKTNLSDRVISSEKTSETNGLGDEERDKSSLSNDNAVVDDRALIAVKSATKNDSGRSNENRSSDKSSILERSAAGSLQKEHSQTSLDNSISREEIIAAKNTASEEILFAASNSGNQLAFADNIKPQEPVWEVEYADIYAMPMGYELIEEEKDKKETVFLAGLNYSTGVFSPNSGGQSFANADAQASNAFNLTSNALSTADFEDQRAAVVSDFRVDREDNYQESVAMSYGANFGVHLTNRLVLFSGLNYTRAYSDLNAGVSVTETQNVLAEGYYGITESREKVVNEYDYVIENEFEFASIPLKAGYAIVNSQFNLTVMTGISTDILLNVNRKTEETEYSYYNAAVEKTTEESFNSVYFNGILGLSAGYLINDRYFLYVEPSYRRAINSFFREDGSSGMANFKMMTFGLSYRFH